MKKLIGYLLFFTGMIFAARQVWMLSHGIIFFMAWCAIAFVGMAMIGSASRTGA